MTIDKQRLIKSQELLQDIQSVCGDFGLHSLKKTVNSVNNFAEQNQYIDIAVLGQFKAGKSSFLNSFVNKAILPVGDIPVTSVISRIRFGLEEKATVTFLDGSSQQIPVDTIAHYVSESGNPENIKNVLLLDIETPILSNIQAIRLVDTPGIGSVWKRNTETTTQWFPETGGVLFLISAEKPISENELQLLKEIYLYSPEISIVISKIDLFPEEHLQQIERFTADVLNRTFGIEFPIIRYSAYTNSKMHNARMQQEIFLPLAMNRDKTYAKVMQHKMGSLVNTCLSYLEISYQASLQKESQKSKLKDIILDEHLNSQFIRRELLLIIGSYKENTRANVHAYLDSFQHDILEKLLKDYESAFPRWKGSLYSLSRQYESWLDQSLNSELKEIMLKEEKSYDLLNSVKKHLSFYLKSFRERLSNNLEQVLGIQVNLEQLEVTVGELKKPDISISRSFDSHLDMFWFLFPMFIFSKVFHRYFSKQIAFEIEKNIHRLTSGLTKKIYKEIDNLMVQALTYMNEEIHMIESLLSENKGDSKYILERIDNIANRFRELS